MTAVTPYKYSVNQVERLNESLENYASIIHDDESATLKDAYLGINASPRTFVGLNGGVSGLLIKEDLSERGYVFQRACFGYLDGFAALMHTSFVMSAPNEPTYKSEAYYDYVINRSPYRHAFMPTTAKHAMSYGVVVNASELPANCAVAGMMALKNEWKYGKGALFSTLTSWGISEDLAFVMTDCLCYWSVDQHYGHFPISEGPLTCWMHLTPEGFASFKSRDAQFLMPSLQDHQGYRDNREFYSHWEDCSIQTMFLSEDLVYDLQKQKSSGEAKSFTKAVFEADGDAIKTYANPFTQRSSGSIQFGPAQLEGLKGKILSVVEAWFPEELGEPS